MLFVTDLLVTMAVALPRGKVDSGPAVDTPARLVLEHMSQNERVNSCISVEFGCTDSEAIRLGYEVERLWNGGHYQAALARLASLEGRVGRVAIANAWRKPVPTIATGLWGRDVRIGNRDSILEVAFDAADTAGTLFVVLRRGAVPHFSVCMSRDTGATWVEAFLWSGSPPASVSATVFTNHLYVAYNSPQEAPEQIRLRRFRTSDGRADTFGDGGSWIAVCTLAVGDTMKEVALTSGVTPRLLCLAAIVSDGSVWCRYNFQGTWYQLPTGITSGASHGLGFEYNDNSRRSHYFISYYGRDDTLRIYGRTGSTFTQRFSMLTGPGGPTSISGRCDTIVCAYEDKTLSPHRVCCAASSDGGDTWTVTTLSDSGIAADAPAVVVSGGREIAAVYRSDAPANGLLFRQRTDSVLWSDPVSITENGTDKSRPGIVYLDSTAYGVVYLSDTSPVVRGAWFDRSDRVYGVTERRQPQTSGHRPQATLVRGVLNLPRDMTETSEVSDRVPRLSLLDISGREVLSLRPGANDVRGLAPGVYFVREGPPAAGREPAMRKVVLTK